MKKPFMKKLLRFTSAFLITLFLLSMIAWTLSPKSWYHKMNDFYDYPEDYDVWFLGSSHVIMGTLPEELYNEYGIRSYNLAAYGQTFAIDYWVTKNLFEITKPKLIVLDAAQTGYDGKYQTSNISSIKLMMSSLPFGKEKIKAINDLFDSESDKDLKTELLFPFASDHYNWEYLTKSNFHSNVSYELGSDQNVFDQRGKSNYLLVTPTIIPEAIDVEDADMTETVNSNYLRKIIELCSDNNVEVLIVKCPLNAAKDKLHTYNQAFAIGKEYGVPYLNGFELENVFDGDTDMWDSSHLNSLGARKWTHELGKYISENYTQIETSTTSPTMKKRWDDRYENYLKFLDSELPLQTFFYSYLMLCTNQRYELDIVIRDGSHVLNDKVAMKLINSCSANIARADKNSKKPDISITVRIKNGDIIDQAVYSFSSKTVNSYTRN